MDEGTLRHSTRIRKSLTVAAFAVAAPAAMAAAWWFVAKERARDVRAWQVRLDLIADSRASDIARWLDGQFATLSSIADNAAVQLYVMPLAATGDPATASEPPERSYLRNLLIVTAEHGGFLRGTATPTVPANVESVRSGGLAIVDRAGRVMVATPGMPPIDDSWRAFLVAATPGRPAFHDVYAGTRGAPTAGFAVPVFQVQGEGNPERQIAWAIGIKDLAPELYPLLRQPGTTETTLETELVRQSQNVVENLSPLLDGARPLERRSEADADHLAEAAALARPGAIGSLADYRGEPVLYTSRTLPHVPWLLVEKIDRAEALADSDVRAERLLILFLVSIGAVGVAFIAVWRHGASARASDAADRYRATARELDHQQRLLALVTDSVPDAIFIVGAETKLTFANKSLGDRFALLAADLVDKPLASVFGPAEARRYAEAAAAATAANGAVIARTDRCGEGPTLRISQTRAVALARESPRRSGVLVLDSDVTDVVRTREKHEAMLQRLVATLVKIVDQRDPSAIGQSERVAEISAEIAREMKLDALAVDTAAVAGRLVNFWKVLVPSDVLTRPGPLSDAEMAQSQQAALKWADFVDGIGFDGPVAETLRQVHEHHDGTGWPKGLKETQVLIVAQIVALANQVVAMTSDRAYRKGADIAEVARLIGQGAGSRYHPGVVAAFLNALENRGGRERWSDAP
jgi:HD-GYP domain-containing protein (c-di-GMP phosphodiesterase class II)